MAEPAAWIGEQPASVADAVARAAAILGASRQAVVAGLVTDAAGVEAAVDLARRIGAAVDHRDAGGLLAGLAVMRRDGWIATTPLQARARSDALLFLGPGIAAAWPDVALRLDAPPALAPDRDPDRARRLMLLGADPATAARLPMAEAVDLAGAEVPIALALAAALLAGRPVRAHPLGAPARRIAALLREAAYGVVAWSGELPEPAVEAAVNLVETANRATRCAGLPLGAGSAETAAQACAWTSGFPMRTGFGRGHAEHDRWRFEATRLVESGEADAALWLAPEPPAWTSRVPTVALLADPAGGNAAVRIAVGAPGIDHAGVLHDATAGTLTWHPATAPTGMPTAATVLQQIAAALPC